MSIYKNGNASTLQIVDRRQEHRFRRLPQALPPELKITPLFDQSMFVRAAINGVLREGLIAACSDRGDDSDFPGRLAADDRHRHLDSAVDFCFDHSAGRARARPSTS